MRLSRRILLMVLLGALVASSLSTLLAHQAMHALGLEPVIWRLAFLNTTFWFGWALLAMPLVALSRRVRIDRAPRIAVPVHLGAIVAAAFVHIALQAASQTFVLWRSTALLRPETLATFSVAEEWMGLFPIELAQLIDWEMVAGAAIVAIAHAFFFHREARQRTDRAAHLEARLIEAQLRMLQSQLQPHFLFNTLHAISTLMHRDVQAADRVLTQLSDLLRLTLDSVTRSEFRLNEELTFIEKYVRIEQVRLGDRLTVEFDVDPLVLDATVPALVLQPLVENAIKHGIAPAGRPGTVKIGAKRVGSELVMTVTDTGSGPSEHVMAALSTGIGVANTRARLQHQFGSDFRFEFQKQDSGFRVLVEIPFRQEPAIAPTQHVA